MTHAAIECFLAICRHKTGSAAAQSLYITQPSLSARLKSLEQELGVPLFHRRKGSREMILTQEGQEFYPLAEQYDELMEKIKKVGKENNALRIASFNSLGVYLLPPVYELFLQKHPQSSLQIQDMEITASSQNAIRGKTDIAFTTARIFNDSLRWIPVCSEPMVLVCSPDSKLQSPVVLSQLSPRKEVYVGWCTAFSHWHQNIFLDVAPWIKVSIMTQLQQFLMQDDRWAIVPISVAKGLTATSDIRQLETDISLPHREIYCVVSKHRTTPAQQAFFNCLRQELAKHPEIECLL